MQNSEESKSAASEGIEKRRVFICYRREDGMQAAEWLYERLHSQFIEGRDGATFQLDVYFDRSAPSVEDFRKVLQPHLELSHAFLLLCTPRAAQRRSGRDWMYDEIDWWLEQRKTAPILVETGGQPDEGIPGQILQRWPNATRLRLPASPEEVDEKRRASAESRLVGQILEGIRISEEGVRHEELERLRRLNRRLRILLLAALAGLVAAVYFALISQQALRESTLREYTAGIAAVDLQIQVKDFYSARARLAKMPPKHRRWEWGHLSLQADPSGKTLQGHSEWVSALDFSPDGKQLASGGRDQSVRVWDVASGRQIALLQDHHSPVQGVAFHSTGKYLASGDMSGLIIVWDAQTWQPVRRLEDHSGGVLAIDYSPQGRYLASGSQDGTVRIWPGDHSSGSSRLLLEDVHPQDLRFAELSPLLGLVTLDGRVMVVNVEQEDIVLEESAHRDLAASISFARQDEWLASGDFQGFIVLTDIANAENQGAFLARPPDQQVHVLALASSPQGQIIASGTSDGLIQLWSVAGQPHQSGVLPGHAGDVNALAYSPHADLLASGSDDSTIKLWPLQPGHAPNQAVALEEGEIWATSMSSDGRWLAVGDDTIAVQVWDLQSLKPASPKIQLNARVLKLAFSGDSSRLGWVDEAGGAQIRKTEGLELVAEIPPSQARFQSLALNRDGTVCYLGEGAALLEAEYSLVSWNPQTTGQPPLKLLSGLMPVGSLVLSPRENILALAPDGPDVLLFDPSSRRILRRLKGHSATVNALAFDRSGERLASASGDQTVRIWDVRTGRETALLRGHTEGVRTVDFSPEGLRLVTGGEDFLVKIWELESQIDLLTLRGHSQIVHGTHFSSDGLQIVSAAVENEFFIWRARKP